MSSENTSHRNKATLEKMWRALSQFDFETLKSCLHPDVHYEDVPTEDSGAIGPENVVARLSVAWDHTPTTAPSSEQALLSTARTWRSSPQCSLRRSARLRVSPFGHLTPSR
jgi:hypothetical protein